MWLSIFKVAVIAVSLFLAVSFFNMVWTSVFMVLMFVVAVRKNPDVDKLNACFIIAVFYIIIWFFLHDVEFRFLWE